MKKKRRITKFSQQTTELYTAQFEADAYPALVSALTLSSLRPSRDTCPGSPPPDYNIRGAQNAFAPNFDSFIQLYVDKPEEARWIPLCKQLLKQRPRRKSDV